jgi:hypothetical protein
MRGDIPPLPQYAFMAWCSLKAQGQILPFTFYVAYQNFKSKRNVKDGPQLHSPAESNVDSPQSYSVHTTSIFLSSAVLMVSLMKST